MYLTMLHCTTDERPHITSTTYDPNFQAQFPRLSSYIALAPHAPPHLNYLTVLPHTTTQRSYSISTTCDSKFLAQFNLTNLNTHHTPHYNGSNVPPPPELCTDFHNALAKYFGVPSHSFRLQLKKFENQDLLQNMRDAEARTRWLQDGNSQFLDGKVTGFQVWAKSNISLERITNKLNGLESTEFSLADHTDNPFLQGPMMQAQSQQAFFMASLR
jgi:hypothetical protein